MPALSVKKTATLREAARPLAGAAAMVLAIAFNLPYARLVAIYDYPDILRRPASEALARFAAGGTELVLTWHAFALAALAMAPVSVALSITPARIATRPALAIGAALFGALAGVTQAIGLWRWVFVIPWLARESAADPAAAAQAFTVLNLYGGVAIGEHLGQSLTAMFVICLSALQAFEGRRILAICGAAAAAAILFGAGEGLAIALDRNGDVFALGTIAGYLGLTLWLFATGAALVRAR